MLRLQRNHKVITSLQHKVIFWKVAERKGRPLSHTLLDFR